MKLKELQKTVNIAWSPFQQESIFLAAGTAAQQFDTNANSTIELYSPNFGEFSYDLELKCRADSPYRFQKLVWSPLGIDGAHKNGLIVGGCEGGHIMIYSAGKLLDNDEPLIHQQDQHTGAVSGLDFNPFQTHLLASCASESEIFIWDLNNPTIRMNPGAKTQPLEDVKNVAWNRQVQHILASVFSTRCVIWDLRKSEQIIKLSDVQSRVRWHSVQWHPDVATQIWLASEDDQAPVVQMWDLRYATAPAKTMQIHQRGMLGMSWCAQDTDLMISCGKDNRIFCWNPNTSIPEGEILSEVATTAAWYSDVQWCPRNPAVIASSSLDGNVSIYSLFGGTQQVVQTTNKIADSFPGMDQFSQAPISQQASQIVYYDLKSPPKWLKRPCGLTFGFGGKIASFNAESKTISLQQVTTDAKLVERVNSLKNTLASKNFTEFCRKRADETTDQNGRYLWYFVKANFEPDTKEELFNLLGYNKDDVKSKFERYVKREESNTDGIVSSIEQALHATTISSTTISRIQDEHDSEAPFKMPDSNDEQRLIAEALLTGNIEAAVELCFEAKRPADALVIASSAGMNFLTRIQNRYLQEQKGNALQQIITALVSHNWHDFVANCSVDSWKQALIASLEYGEGDGVKICEALGDKLANEDNNIIDNTRNAILCYIYSGSIGKLITNWYKLKRLEGNCSNYKLNTAELQDLAEVTLLISNRFEPNRSSLKVNEEVADFLLEYLQNLVSQGALSAALKFYNTLAPSPGHPRLESLGERISCSLNGGRQQTFAEQKASPVFALKEEQHYSQYATQSQEVKQPPSALKPFGQEVNHNVTLMQNTRIQPPSIVQQQSPFGFNSPAVPSHTQFSHTAWPTVPAQASSNAYASSLSQVPLQSHQNANLDSFPTSASVWPSTAKSTVSPPPPPFNFNPTYPSGQPTPKPPQSDINTQPPRPLSNASSHCSTGNASTGGILSRSKYVLDPSVASAGNNDSLSYGLQYNAAAPLQAHLASTQNPPGVSPYANPTGFPLAGQTQSQFIAPPFTGVSTYGPPPFSGADLAPPAQAPFQNIQRNPTPPPGWNDPPALRPTTRRAKQADKSATVGAQAPIKHPLMPAPVVSPLPLMDKQQQPASIQADQNQNGLLNANQNQVQPPPMTGGVGATYYHQDLVQNNNNSNSFTNENPPHPTMPFFGQQPQTLQAPYPGQWNTPINQQQAPPGSIYSPVTVNAIEPLQSASKVETPKEKLPLPEEYSYLQTVLEELKSQCIDTASDQRTKRKFVDIAKRLESLYDCLRDGRLTNTTTTALNEMVQNVQIGNYVNGLEILRQMAFGPDFSQCGIFLSGLKALIQSAADMQVYLR